MEIRYKEIDNELHYAEIGVTKDSKRIYLHYGLVGDKGKSGIIECLEHEIKDTYMKYLTEIKDDGYKIIPKEQHHKLIAQIDLPVPFNEDVYQYLYKIYNEFHIVLRQTGNGMTDNIYRFEVFKDYVIFHLRTIDKNIAFKSLSKVLEENSIETYKFGELLKDNSGELICPVRIEYKDFESYKHLTMDGGPYSFVDVSHIHQVDEIMDEDLYWSIIQKSLQNTSSQKAQEIFLTLELMQLPPKQILTFYNRTTYFIAKLQIQEVECADFLINGGSGDDGFLDFRVWIISRGKNTFYETLKNADYLINELIDEWDHHSFQGFNYVSNDAFEFLSGKNSWELLGTSDIVEKEAIASAQRQAHEKELWHPAEPESIKTLCPNLFKKLWQGIFSSENYQLSWGKEK